MGTLRVLPVSPPATGALRILCSRRSPPHQTSFDQLRALPALKNIALVPLHQGKEKRRRCPETGEPYTMYDVELDEPVSTVAKLVGKSKNNTVVSLQRAADQMRREMKAGIRIGVLGGRFFVGRVCAHVSRVCAHRTSWEITV